MMKSYGLLLGKKALSPLFAFSRIPKNIGTKWKRTHGLSKKRSITL